MVRKIVVALTGLLLLAAPAQAVPGGGAGPNTPGTSGSASPRQLTAGSTIHFTVSGFPAGEVVYVKIDDGSFCSDKGVHGACVVHQQRLSGNGSAAGSFVLPSDLQPGHHWLRFLASEEMTDANGNYLGTKGYTSRAGTDFTVVTGGGPSTASGSAASTGPASTGSTGSTGALAAGAADAPVLAAGKVLTVNGTVKKRTTPSAAPTPDPTVAPSAEPSSASEAETAAVVPTASESSRFPYVGVAGLVVLAAAAAGLLLRTRRRA